MNGVQVYPHVTGGKWCADCNLPLDICRGHDDNTMRAASVDVAGLAQQIAALPVQTLVELAMLLVAVDAAQADRFADMLLDAVYDAEQVKKAVAVADLPPVRGRITQAMIRPSFHIDPSEYGYSDGFDEYEYLPSVAQ